MKNKTPLRRAHHEGSVRQRPDGRWEVRFTIPASDGEKARRKSYYCHTKQEAVQILRGQWDPQWNLGPNGTTLLTVGEWLEIWLEHKELSLKPSTLRHYKSVILSPYFRPAIIGHRRPSPQDRHSRRFRLFKVSVCAVIPLQLHAAVMQAVQRRVVGGANPSACQILHVGGVCRRVVLPYFIMASRVAVAFARYRRVRQPAHTSISVISHVGSPSSWCRHQPGHTAG